VTFKGIIANYRKKGKNHIYFVGVGKGEYYEIFTGPRAPGVTTDPLYKCNHSKVIGCYGVGVIVKEEYNVIQAETLVLY